MQQGSSGAAGEKQKAETFVLVHGAWGGAWDWRNVERGLRAPMAMMCTARN